MLVSGSSLGGHYAYNEAMHTRYKWPPTMHMAAGYAVVPALRTGSGPGLVKARLSTPAVRGAGLQLETARRRPIANNWAWGINHDHACNGRFVDLMGQSNVMISGSQMGGT